MAEYLDNRLRSEKTAEIEKICIESDMQLAEVAACHQILSQILGKPLQSPHELRQRLYSLQDLDINEGQPHTDADFARPALASTAASVPASDDGGSHGAWYYVLVGALSLSITLVLLAGGTYLLGGFGGDDVVTRDPNGSNGDAPVVEGDPQPALVDPANKDKGTDSGTNAGASDATTVIPIDKIPPAGDGGPPTEVTGPPSESTGEGPADTTVPATGEAPEGVTTDEEAPPAPTTASPPTLIVAPSTIGSVADVRDRPNLVAIVDAQNVDATRIPVDGKIVTGESYVTFPHFESAVLASPFHLRFLGDSHWGFEGASGDGTLTLHLEQGTVRIVADQPVGLSVRLNGHVEAIKFEEPGTELAIRVAIDRLPGDDPREVVSPHVADFCLIKGKATLGSAKPPLPLEVNKPMRWTEGVGIVASPAEEPAALSSEAPAVAEGAPAEPVFPAWIDGDERGPLEESAVSEILAALPQDRSLKLSLTEMVVSAKQEEVQAIAAWALCSLAYFDPALQCFDDPDQHSYWQETLLAVRRDLPLSQEAAVALRTAVENKFPDAAENVWSMLIGFSPDGLAAGGDSDLVANLDRPELAIRGLAFLNLFEITDITHTYRPEVVENRRRSALGRWQQMLAAGGIRYLHPPVSASAAGTQNADPAVEASAAPDVTTPETPSAAPAADRALPPIFEESDAPPPPTAEGEEEPTEESSAAP